MRRLLAATTAVLALTVLPSAPAQATVTSSSGAWADTTMVCQRGLGTYVLSVRGSGFQYARFYLTNGYTRQAGWTAWTSGFWGNSSGIPLPRMGSVAVYVEYAYNNGRAWEFAGLSIKARRSHRSGRQRQALCGPRWSGVYRRL